MMRRMVAMLLVLVLAVGMLPTPAYAAAVEHTEEMELVPVDLSALGTAMDESYALLNGSFTPESLAALEAALDEAQAVFYKDGTTQEEADEALGVLLDAMDALEEAKAPLEEEQPDAGEKPAENEMPSGADITNLMAAIAEAIVCDEADYTPESWAALMGALEKACAVPEDADQETVDEAWETLADALAALEALPREDDNKNHEADALETLEDFVVPQALTFTMPETDGAPHEDFEDRIQPRYYFYELELGEKTEIYNGEAAAEIIAGASVTLDGLTVTAEAAGTTVVALTDDGHLDYNTAYVIIEVVNESKADINIATDLVYDYEEPELGRDETMEYCRYFYEGNTMDLDFSVIAIGAESISVSVNGGEWKQEPGDAAEFTVELENRQNIIGIRAETADGRVRTFYKTVDARLAEIYSENEAALLDESAALTIKVTHNDDYDSNPTVVSVYDKPKTAEKAYYTARTYDVSFVKTEGDYDIFQSDAVGSLMVEAYIPHGTAKSFGTPSNGQLTLDLISESSFAPNSKYPNNMYTSVDRTGSVELEAGGEFVLDMFRAYQCLFGDSPIGNDFVEPPFYFEVYGDSATVEDVGTPTRNQLKITAVNNGVTVIKITYGPAEYGGKFGAIDDYNTYAVVVNVGGGSFDTGITLDQEFDTCYFDAKKEDHRDFTFTPASGSTVRVHAPLNRSSWGNGWTAGTRNGDQWTVSLYQGRNIIEIQNGGSVRYQVVKAIGAQVTIENLSSPGETDIALGETAHISVSGIEQPVLKMTLLYNPCYNQLPYLRYSAGLTAVNSSKGAQYMPRSSSFTLDYTLEDAEENILTGDIQGAGGFYGFNGQYIGSHRHISTGGVSGGGMAMEMGEQFFGSLPVIEIPVAEREAGSVFEKDGWLNIECGSGNPSLTDQISDRVGAAKFDTVTKLRVTGDVGQGDIGSSIKNTALHLSQDYNLSDTRYAKLSELVELDMGRAASLDIPNQGFRGIRKLEKLRLPAQFTKGAYAFVQMPALTTLAFGDAPYMEGALDFTGYQGADIPSGLFPLLGGIDNKKAEKLILPGGKAIGDKAFAAFTGLKEVVFTGDPGEISKSSVFAPAIKETAVVYVPDVEAARNSSLPQYFDTIKSVEEYESEDVTEVRAELDAFVQAAGEKYPENPGFTSYSWNAYQDALTRAMELLEQDSPLLTQADFENALSALEEAILYLTADKSELKPMIAEANKFRESDWSAETWAQLTKALEAAKQVYYAKDPQVEDVQTALTDLCAAIDGLKEPLGDTQWLRAQAARLEEASRRDVIASDADWLELQDALGAARSVLAVKEPTKSQVTEAEIRLNTALQKVVLADNLRKEIASADTLRETDYTPATWAPFAKALADARALLNDKSITQKNVDEATRTLNQAAMALKTVGTPGIKSVTVTFRLYGDEKHEEGQHQDYQQWIAQRYTFPNVSRVSVYDVFVQAIKESGLEQKGAEDNYVSQIKGPDGKWLAEFDNGPNSGWMYMVDGRHPDFGLKDCYVTDGQDIVWHYADDFKTETPDFGKPDIPQEPDVPAERADLYEAYKKTYSYLRTMTPATGVMGGEWLVLGLARSEFHDLDEQYIRNYYTRVAQLEFDEGDRLNRNKSTDNSRVILALTAIGIDPTKVADHDLIAGLNEMDYINHQGINGSIWALIALGSHGYKPAAPISTEGLIQEILSRQQPDGSFGNTDLTAMALTALAPYRSDDAVQAAVDKTLNYLSELQTSSGGFPYGSQGESVESCAQVIVALSALGIDADNFEKDGHSVIDAFLSYYDGNGVFYHKQDHTGETQMSTEQALYAMSSYFRSQKKEASLFDMRDIKLEDGETSGGIKPGETADKTALKASISKAKALHKADYTETTWNYLELKLEAAENILADSAADQVTVDNAQKYLENAIKTLRPDKTALKAAITKAENLKSSDYTAKSWAEVKNDLTKALADAKQVRDTNTATLDEVNDAIKVLEDIMDKLVKNGGGGTTGSTTGGTTGSTSNTIFGSNSTTAARSKLDAEVKKAELLKKEDYTEDSWKIFETALKNAQDTLKKSNATATQLSNAYTKLAAAEKTLKKVGETLEESRKKLDAQVKEDEKLVQSDYTAETWKPFADAMAEAKKVLASEDPTAKQMDDAYTSLVNARMGLEKYVDYRSALESLVEKCGDLVEDSYTAESWAVFMEALNNAKEALKDETTDQKTFAQLLDELNEAGRSLVPAEYREGMSTAWRIPLIVLAVILGGGVVFLLLKRKKK